jgi:hypothetical protein
MSEVSNEVFKWDEILEKKIELVVNRILSNSNYFKGWVGTIKVVNPDSTVDILLSGNTDSATYYLKNKKVLSTAGTSHVGDEVYLISPYNSISNSLVFINKSNL